MTDPQSSTPPQDSSEKSEGQQPHPLFRNPLVITLGLLALVVGVLSGLLMSTVTVLP